MGIRVCHLSSVHKVNDVRILHKECRTLAAAGYDVTLIARPAGVDGGDVTIIQLEPSGGRVARMLLGAWKAYRLAREQGAVAYHFHDPELLPYGLMLKAGGARVIYDSHECYSEDIVAKEWIPRPLRALVAALVERIENFATRRLDLVVAATPHIEKRFKGVARHTVTINNYPLPEEFARPDFESGSSPPRDGFCYVGTITKSRGIIELLDALDTIETDIKFYLAGVFGNVEAEVYKHRNWPRVTFLGHVSRAEVGEIYSKSFAGIVNFLPVPNHVYSQPNKLFEYMSAGIPVICSNFQLWREVVEQGECGICVDPASPAEIGHAVNLIRADAALREQYSANGRRLVVERYSWGGEGRSLVSAYESILASR